MFFCVRTRLYPRTSGLGYSRAALNQGLEKATLLAPDHAGRGPHTSVSERWAKPSSTDTSPRHLHCQHFSYDRPVLRPAFWSVSALGSHNVSGI